MLVKVSSCAGTCTLHTIDTIGRSTTRCVAISIVTGRILTLNSTFKDDVYYVHVFNSRYMDASFHGLQIGRNKFHSEARKEELPDPDLCRWHYEQCVMLYLRGFSSGMALSKH